MRRNVPKDVFELWRDRDLQGGGIVLAVFLIALACQLLVMWWDW